MLHVLCVVWHAESEHNITCRMKFRGETLTSTGMSGPFNPPGGRDATLSGRMKVVHGIGKEVMLERQL